MYVSWVEIAGMPNYSDFKQSRSVGNGGTFDFNFSKKGAWLYENLNDKTKTGVVVVE